MHLDAPKTPSGLHLTAMEGISDQTHFVDAEWYLKEVIASIPREKQLTCVEHLSHDPWKESPERLLTILYGGVQEDSFVFELICGSQVNDVQGHLWKLSPATLLTCRVNTAGSRWLHNLCVHNACHGVSPVRGDDHQVLSSFKF